MAITKLLRIKEAKSGSVSSGLKACLKYIANPDKTENLLLTGGSCGGDPDLTYSDMMSNKRSWDQTDGTQGFHYILSFPPNEEIDIPTLRAITEDFCSELLGDAFLHAYAIHDDRKHLHSHICFDSVSLKDGHIFHSGQYDWLARIQPITDKLCEKYGLHALNFDPENRTERQNRYHEEWEKDNVFTSKKNVSWIDIIRTDTDIALSKSQSWEEFLQCLRDMHYEVKDGQHLSLKPLEKERFTRSGRCGEAYTKENLMKRLGEPLKQTAFGEAEPMLRALREFFQNTGQSEIKGIKVVYFQRWYAYSYVNRSRTPWKYRKELTELGKFTDRCAYIFQHDITTAEDLQTHLQSLQEKKMTTRAELVRTNNQLYNTPLSDWKRLEKLRAKLENAPVFYKPVINEQISVIVKKLQEKDIVTESAKYRSLLEKKLKLQLEQKTLKAEIKMSADLIDDLKKIDSRGDIMLDPNRFIPPPFTDKCYHRITINKIIVQETPEDSDFIKVKIPGRAESLLLYKADTKIADNDAFASSYIYDHLNYIVVDRNDKNINEIAGADVMNFFTDRTREKVR